MEGLEDRRVLATWQPIGPSPSINGQVEKVTPNNEVVGAIHAVLAHPTNANILYAGGTNGGVWRTDNARSTSPDWTPLIDDMPSLSIGAMDMDPNNPNRLVVGTARMSSLAHSGSIGDLYLTNDGGNNWSIISDPLFAGENISGVQVNGDLILVATGGGFFFQTPEPDGGLYRSVDGGQNWTSIELLLRDPNNPDDPLPFQSMDLVDDPSDPNRYYASVQEEGVFLTVDAGESWSNVSSGDTALNGVIVGGGNNNIEMAVANDGRIYVAAMTFGQPQYIGYSDSQGGGWIEMDLPQTPEPNNGGIDSGLNPRAKAGGQGFIHFSILADPDDPKTVYVGGDRQDAVTDALGNTTGNFIGARDFSGRLFRGDTRVAPGGVSPSPQWEHLTHSDRVVAIPGGGTRRGSAPHADSRDMVFDAAGDLIEVDDGGIYRRTSPKDKTGDWYSINGDIQVTEFHNIAYDSNSNIVVGGTQDIGAIEQNATGSKTWRATQLPDQEFRLNADGGDVAIDDTTLPGRSIRYFSVQLLGFFRRQIYDSANRLLDTTLINAPSFAAQFTTPIELNEINQTRLVVGMTDGVYESLDRGDTFQRVPGPGATTFNPDETVTMVYGGRRNGQNNPDVIYVGAEGEVWVRSKAGENLNITVAQFPGGQVRDIVLDPEDWRTAYVIDRDDIFVTRNAGTSWQNLSGNLAAVATGELRSIEFIQKGTTRAVVIGTDRDAYVMQADKPAAWSQFGDLPNTPIFDLDYDRADDVLTVGTFGRGAFQLKDASKGIGETAVSVPNSVSGVKWNDINGNGKRDTGEPGIPGVYIYVDVNRDDDFGIGEPAALTDANGNYRITKIPNGTFAVREIADSGLTPTFPVSGEYIITFSGGTNETNVNFGNRVGSGNNNGFDFGDAPASYGTLLADNGASHSIVSGFHLGARIDGEPNGQPTPFALGDDNNGPDEDGVTFLTDLIPGETARVQVSVNNGSQPGGMLQAWIDFDRDGDFTSVGDRIFTNQVVSQGLNTLTFVVPAGAIEGATFARFRYAYEKDLGPTGRAVAGEVEDHLVNIIRGGPVARDDSYQVRRNSDDNVLRVTTNDEIRPNSNTVISSISTPNQGGTVSIATNGTTLLYTPREDFSGVETFTYTLQDKSGLTDSARVTVTVPPDLVQIRLAAADLDGDPITSITVGGSFMLQGYVKDLRPTATGVFAAYHDVTYTGALASVTGPLGFGDVFPNGQSGSTAVDGLIDEVGAFDGVERLGPDEQLLFMVQMRADATGTISFDPSPADVLPLHSILLFDRGDAVPDTQVEYRSTTLTVTAAQAAFATNPRNALDVNDDTSVSPIDALLIINELNADQSPQARAGNQDSSLYLDVSGDGSLSPLDALLVINALNRLSDSQTNPPLAAVAAAMTDEATGPSEQHELTDIWMSHDADEKEYRLLAEAERADSIFDHSTEEREIGGDEIEASLDAISEDIVRALA